MVRFILLVVLVASLLPTGTAFAQTNGNLAPNADFEGDVHGVGCCSNVANDWTHFHMIRVDGRHPAWQFHEPQYGNNRNDHRRNGNGAMSWGKDHATYDAGIWTRVRLPGGTGRLTLTAWMRSWSGNGNNWGDSPQGDTGKLIGIDPTGNTDVWSSSVIWSAENRQQVDWVQVSVTTEARGDYATIYLRSRNDLPMNRNATFVDEVRFTMDQAPAAPVAPAPAPGAPPTQVGPCEFKLGFKLLRNQVPNVVGDCAVDEHHNPINGDALQETSRGLMVWRKADNFTAFTDGHRTWVNGPLGVQQRLNTERFAWEVASPVAAPAAPVAPPVAAPLPAAPAPLPPGLPAPAPITPGLPQPIPPGGVPAPAPAAPPAPVAAAPAALEQEPWALDPADGAVVGEAAELKWDWHRALAPNEEFVLVLRQENPAGRTWWRGKREKFHFTTGDELPPGRILRWKVYVRITNSETLISREIVERGVQRRS